MAGLAEKDVAPNGQPIGFADSWALAVAIIELASDVS